MLYGFNNVWWKGMYLHSCMLIKGTKIVSFFFTTYSVSNCVCHPSTLKFIATLHMYALCNVISIVGQ